MVETGGKRRKWDQKHPRKQGGLHTVNEGGVNQ